MQISRQERHEPDRPNASTSEVVDQNAHLRRGRTFRSVIRNDPAYAAKVIRDWIQAGERPENNCP